MRWGGQLAALAVLLAVVPVGAQQWTIEDPGQGPVPLPAGVAGARELSGIAWVGDDRYVAVSDEGGDLFTLRIALDARDGRVRGGAVEARLALAGSHDLEGVAVNADGTRVLVADERGPTIREYRLADGERLRTVEVPARFAALRSNLGLEALARGADGSLWTANEDALMVDGPTSSREAGSWVRLQRFDAALRPAEQYAYRLDAVGGEMLIPNRGTGLSELVALPDGRLLALERSLSTGGLRIRLYAIEIGDAADVGRIADLSDAKVSPVRKHLLWERQSPRENFEGAALGPTLADGSRSLLLLSDDGHGLTQMLYPLRLRAR